MCHNSKPGGVVNACLDCHHYHNDPRAHTIHDAARPATTTADGGSRLREMLSGAPVAAAAR